MAQALMRDVVAELAERLTFPDPIVEFGALQVEPDQDGDLRPLFPKRPYIGTDLRDGPGVDRIEDLRALRFSDGEVGTALCLDTLEHCADPPAACRELARVVAPGGVCVISSVMLFGIHAYPSDYFRFTPEGFRVMLEGFDGGVSVAGVGDPGHPYAVLGVGVRAPAALGGFQLADLPTLRAAQERFERGRGRVRVGPLRYPPGELVRALARETPRLVRERFGRSLRRSPVRSR